MSELLKRTVAFGLTDLQGKIEKAWSDAAREASAEARRRHAVHIAASSAARRDNNFKASQLHAEAARQYGQASANYDKGSKTLGDKHMAAGSKAGNRAYDAESYTSD